MATRALFESAASDEELRAAAARYEPNAQEGIGSVSAFEVVIDDGPARLRGGWGIPDFALGSPELITRWARCVEISATVSSVMEGGPPNALYVQTFDERLLSI